MTPAPLNKTALGKRHYFVTDDDMIQYPDISMDGVYAGNRPERFQPPIK